MALSKRSGFKTTTISSKSSLHQTADPTYMNLIISNTQSVHNRELEPIGEEGKVEEGANISTSDLQI